MTKKRDHKAEYQRRNVLARERGYKSHSAYRRAMESGKTPALRPTQLRSRRSIDAQEASWSFLGRNTSVQALRIQAAQDWSDSYAKAWQMKFDAKRAKKDEQYLSAYLGATVFNEQRDGRPLSDLFDSDALRKYFVDVMEIYTDDEYEERYGSSTQ